MSPLLNIQVTLASFHSLGKIPSLSDLLNRIVIGRDILSTVSFKNQEVASSSYKVQAPSGVYSYCHSAVQELSTVDLKTWPKCMYSAVKNIQYFLSHDDWLDFPLEAVDSRAAYYWLGKAVPELDGVREEGSLVDLGSGISLELKLVLNFNEMLIFF